MRFLDNIQIKYQQNNTIQQQIDTTTTTTILSSVVEFESDGTITNSDNNFSQLLNLNLILSSYSKIIDSSLIIINFDIQNTAKYRLLFAPNNSYIQTGTLAPNSAITLKLESFAKDYILEAQGKSIYSKIKILYWR